MEDSVYAYRQNKNLKLFNYNSKVNIYFAKIENLKL
jgi:hypothetical protein